MYRKRYKYSQRKDKSLSLEELTVATATTTTHPDLTELHLDLFGDYIGPIFLSQEVPEYPSQKCIYPGLRLRSLL